MPAPASCSVTSTCPVPSLARLPTFPADRPALQIDHVLASGPLPEPVAVAGPRLDLSDHRALVVDLGSR
jgi:endonuclease/exonuclease/phosphatase (EEP) superfamily protein YafD